MTEQDRINLAASIAAQRLAPPNMQGFKEILHDPKRDLYYVTTHHPGFAIRCEHCGHLDWNADPAPGWVDRRDIDYFKDEFPKVIYQAPE